MEGKRIKVKVQKPEAEVKDLFPLTLTLSLREREVV